jgi:HK97 family phage major capsid protein
MNRTEVLELRRKRADLIAQARTVNNEAPNGVMDAEREAKWNTIMADADALKARIDREERLADEESNLDRSITEPNRPDLTSRDGGVVANTAEFENAFRAWVVGGNADLSPEQRSIMQQFRAQSVGTNSAGGYTVPQGFKDSLEVALKNFSGVLQAPVSAFSTDAGNALPWPTLNDTASVGELVAENTAVTAADLTFGVVTFNAYKYSSKTMLFSFELMQDGAFSADALVAPRAGERIGRIWNQHLTTGTGTGQPQGIVVGATVGPTTAAVAAVTFDEVLDLIHSVDPAYRGCRPSG